MIPILNFFNWYNQLLLVLGRLSLVELDTIVYWLSYSVAKYLLLTWFQAILDRFFQGAHQFWASLAKGVGEWEAKGGGVGWEVEKAFENVSRVVPQWRHGHQSSP